MIILITILLSFVLTSCSVTDQSIQKIEPFKTTYNEAKKYIGKGKKVYSNTITAFDYQFKNALDTFDKIYIFEYKSKDHKDDSYVILFVSKSFSGLGEAVAFYGPILTREKGLSESIGILLGQLMKYRKK